VHASILTALAVAFFATSTACADSSSRPDAQLPVRSLSFTVEPTSRAKFLAAIESTAKVRGLEYRTAQVSPDAVRWILEAENSDFRIIVVNDLTPEHFKVRAYQNVTDPLPMDRLEEFLAKLQQAVQVVPGVRLGASDPLP
jgi:hypothetical protein